jgi:molybdenum cofactor cytidylyltransferase
VNVVCVILAAGRSERMGAQKLLLPVGGTTMLARALDASREFETVVVAAQSIAAHIPRRPGLRVVVNDESERGMAHSLALADATIGDRSAALVVLLADTPLVDAALVRRIVDARGDADVAFPVRGGVGGHPVVFGPRARTEFASLQRGDTLRRLRDDPNRSRIGVPVDDDAPFLDVDSPGDLARAGEVLSLLVEPLGSEAKS